MSRLPQHPRRDDILDEDRGPPKHVVGYLVVEVDPLLITIGEYIAKLELQLVDQDRLVVERD